MKNIIQKIAQSLALVPLMALSLSVVAVPATANAACNTNNLSIASGADCAQGNNTPSNLFGGNNSIFKTVTNILLFLVGAISVIMLIIGGIRYVVSAGDQTQVTAAKNTILYAIVGIIVAFLAYAAVNFVTKSLS
jgi:hypothetical protein